jgi:hypothetical protein
LFGKRNGVIDTEGSKPARNAPFSNALPAGPEQHNKTIDHIQELLRNE